MLIKQWLDDRIAEVEKKIKFNRKYDFLIYTGAFMLGSFFYVIPQLLINHFDVLFTSVVAVGFLVYILIIRWRLNVNYQKTLKELKELYGQIE